MVTNCPHKGTAALLIACDNSKWICIHLNRNYVLWQRVLFIAVKEMAGIWLEWVLFQLICGVHDGFHLCFFLCTFLFTGLNNRMDTQKDWKKNHEISHKRSRGNRLSKEKVTFAITWQKRQSLLFSMLNKDSERYSDWEWTETHADNDSIVNIP